MGIEVSLEQERYPSQKRLGLWFRGLSAVVWTPELGGEIRKDVEGWERDGGRRGGNGGKGGSERRMVGGSWNVVGRKGGKACWEGGGRRRNAPLVAAHYLDLLLVDLHPPSPVRGPSAVLLLASSPSSLHRGEISPSAAGGGEGRGEPNRPGGQAGDYDGFPSLPLGRGGMSPPHLSNFSTREIHSLVQCYKSRAPRRAASGKPEGGTRCAVARHTLISTRSPLTLLKIPPPSSRLLPLRVLANVG